MTLSRFNGISFLGSMILGPIFILFGLLFFDSSAILIESRESKTISGSEVFNKIQFHPGWQKDTWLMEQSHQGLKASKHNWDKIAIVVNKKQNTAKFYQYQNSEKPISLNLRPINFKVSCFFCHSNGPRVVRPNFESKFVSLSLWNKARISLWNFRIKSYGRVLGQAGAGQHPFKHSSTRANQPLKVKTCTICHKDQGFLARGQLTKQNFMTIKFMLEEKLMPPLGIALSQEEEKEIQEFLKL